MVVITSEHSIVYSTPRCAKSGNESRGARCLTVQPHYRSLYLSRRFCWSKKIILIECAVASLFILSSRRFDGVLEHVLRIDRVLRQPMGHLLLVGEAGAGKTVLSRFVSWMNGLGIFQASYHMPTALLQMWLVAQWHYIVCVGLFSSRWCLVDVWHWPA